MKLTKFILVAALCCSTIFAKKQLKKEYADDPVVCIKTSEGDIVLELFAKEAPDTVKNFIELAEGKKEFTDAKTQKKVKRPFYDGLIFHRVIKNFMIQGGCPLGTGTGDPGYKFKDEINANALGLDKEKAMVNNNPNSKLGIRSRGQFQAVILAPIYKKLEIKSKADFEAKKDKLQTALNKLTLKEALTAMGYKYNDKLKSHMPKRGVIAMANSGPNTNGSQFFINLIDTDWLAGKHTVFGKVISGMDIVDKIGKTKVTKTSSKPIQDIKIISIRVVKDK